MGDGEVATGEGRDDGSAAVPTRPGRGRRRVLLIVGVLVAVLVVVGVVLATADPPTSAREEALRTCDAAFFDDGVEAPPTPAEAPRCDEDFWAGVLPAVAGPVGNTALLELLLDKGVDPNAAGALEATLDADSAERARLLLDAGAEPDRREARYSWAGSSLLFAATADGHPDIARLLVDAGADPDVSRDLTYLDVVILLSVLDDDRAKEAVAKLGPGLGIEPEVLDAIAGEDELMDGFMAVADLPGSFDLDAEVGRASVLWLASVAGDEDLVAALIGAGAEVAGDAGPNGLTAREAAEALGEEAIARRLAAAGG